MATLIKADGTRREIQPKNGTDFKLEELQAYVDGYIEIVNLRNGELLVINEEGKYIYDTNNAATDLAHEHHALFPGDYINGDVVLCKDEEVQ
jgi:hypothetical protein